MRGRDAAPRAKLGRDDDVERSAGGEDLSLVREPLKALAPGGVVACEHVPGLGQREAVPSAAQQEVGQGIRRHGHAYHLQIVTKSVTKCNHCTSTDLP